MDTELLHSLDLSSTVDAKLANSLNANCPVDTKLTDSLSISSPLDTEILDSLVTKGTVDAKLADSSDINCLKNTKLVDSLNVNCSVDTKFSDSLDANSPVDAKLVGTSGFKRSMNNNPFFSSDATDLTFEESVPAVTDNLNLRYSSLTSFTSQYGSDDDKKITEQAYTNQEAVVNRVNADILAVEKNLHKENVPAENKVPKSKVNKPFQSPQVHCENLTDPETFQNFDTIPQAPDTDSSAHADSQPKSNTPFPTKNPISVTGVNSNSINDSNANGRAITGGIFQSLNRREVSKADLATEAENAAPNSSNDKQNISFAEMPTSVKKKRSLSALRRKSLLAWGNWNKAEPVPPTPAIPQSVLTSNPVHKQGGESKGFSSQENTEKLDNERVKKQSSSTINTAETKAKTKGQTSSPNWTDSLNKKFLGGKTKLKKENVPTPKSTSTPVSSSGPFTNVVGGIGYSPSNNNSTKKVKEDKASKDRRMGSFFLRLLGKKSTGKTNKTNSFDCLATIT
ncbi:hypothetical protein BY996DRAFT_6814869 [Phakopsora pachyrhizi]|nr:hypothetical protein BY996DRAFT_6814869 [Phakopsora pachyrhizi]